MQFVIFFFLNIYYMKERKFNNYARLLNWKMYPSTNLAVCAVGVGKCGVFSQVIGELKTKERS